MRLAAECPEQQPRGNGPAIDEQGRGPQQAGGQKAVLPYSDRPQHWRERQDRNQDHPAALAEDAPHHQEIKTESDSLEDDKGKDVRQMSEPSAEEQKYRRVIEEVVDDTGPGRVLLGGVMRSLVVSKMRHAGVRQTAGSIKAHEIGAGRLFQRYDQPVGPCRDEDKKRDFDREQGGAQINDPRPRQQPGSDWRRQVARRAMLGITKSR